MAEIIRMPRMSDTMEEGNIVAWLKKVGEEVEPGDILAEVETDKATMELESYHEGVLLHIGVAEGPVPVDGVIAVIGEEGEDFEEALKSAGDAAPAPTEEAKADTNKDSEAATPAAQTNGASPASAAAAVTDSKVKASPLAKKMAEDKGINLGTVQGSGPEGRIVKRDLENVQPSSGTSAQTPVPALSFTAGETQDIPLSQMRKTIARRLGESKFQAPHFYLTADINMDNAVAARQLMKSQTDVKVSFNDIIIKACALALKQHPYVNASWTGESIRLNGEVNIGVAVAVDEGLLVPVIKHADQKPMSLISQEVREKAGKARDKKLSLDEMQGNTFSISNLGMFDIDEFTAIINPPDSCILAVGSIRKVPVVNEKNEVVVGNRMKVTMSCDHRVVDGAIGAQFLKTVRLYLENPMMMLV